MQPHRGVKRGKMYQAFEPVGKDCRLGAFCLPKLHFVLCIAHGCPQDQDSDVWRLLQDRNLADHVMRVHAEGVVPNTMGNHELLSPDQIRAYIGYVKTLDPYIPESLTGKATAQHSTCSLQGLACLGCLPASRTALDIFCLL